MKSKTHRTAVVLIPPMELWPPIQAIRQKHDRQFRRWMPHITLLYPFRPVTEFDTVSQEFHRVCASLRPFGLELVTFNLFQHARRSCTMWLRPEPEELVVELQTRVWQVVPDCDEVRRHPNGFAPHLSVGQARGRGVAERLMDDWQVTWEPLRFRVSEICLIWRNDPPDDAFRAGGTIRLGSA